MRYFLAIVLPPLAVFLCGKPVQGLLNIILTLMGWVPGAVHALFVVHNHFENQRADKIVDALKNSKKD